MTVSLRLPFFLNTVSGRRSRERMNTAFFEPEDSWFWRKLIQGNALQAGPGLSQLAAPISESMKILSSKMKLVKSSLLQFILNTFQVTSPPCSNLWNRVRNGSMVGSAVGVSG